MTNEWKKWHRALNASRREVVKAMTLIGLRTSVWTKRDKGRTIMEVFTPNTVSITCLRNAVREANRKWATRLVSERGTQWFIGLSPVNDGYCLTTEF